MNTLRLYRIREDYVRYLHSLDKRVQYNKSTRPYVGTVLSINGHDYFVPMESPKDNHKNLKSNVHIYKIENGKYGILGFNNMIPAKKHHLIEFDIEKEPDIRYRNLLKNQLIACRRDEAEIFRRAQKTYDAVVRKKSPFFVGISCDFELLEKEYTKFYYKAEDCT